MSEIVGSLLVIMPLGTKTADWQFDSKCVRGSRKHDPYQINQYDQ